MNQHDVANLARVSSATVSRVINNEPNVSDKTAKKVIEIIHKYGYVQNAVARNLRMASTKIIGYLVPDISNPFFPQVLGGIEAACWKKGYDVILENTHEEINKEKEAINTLLQYRVDGVIADFVDTNSDDIKKFEKMGIPLVMIDRKVTVGEKTDSIIVDNVGGMVQIVEYLIGLGHKKIAMIHGSKINTPGIERMEGFYLAMQSAGIEINEDYVLNGMFSEEGGYACTCKLMHMKEPPTAIITANNVMTMGTFKALVDNFIQIPKDVSLVGFDDFPMAAYLSPPLTVINRPTWEMGQIAAEILLERIENKNADHPMKEMVLPTNLLIRESCAPVIKI